MKIVIDSNRVIAALIKESTMREILFNKNFKFYAPEYIKNEIEKYENEIMTKANVSKEEFDTLLSLIFEFITIVSQNEYQEFVEGLKGEINDPKDIAYLAVCLFLKADGIWTHDPHFKEQKKFKVYTNIDMLGFGSKLESYSD